MNILNYREFYQRALIPMSDFDKQHFCKEFCGDCNNCIKANHWLIAIQGFATKVNSDIFEWKIVVYPAKENGEFSSLNPPYYESANPYSLSQAIEESKRIVGEIVDSTLTAKTMLAS